MKRSTVVAGLALLCVAAFSGTALAQRNSVTTGNWNSTSTWNTATVPTDATAVGITNGNTVTFQAGDSWSGGGWPNGLQIGYDASIGGLWGLGGSGAGVLNVTGGTLNTGMLGMGGGAVGTLNISGGSVNANSDMLLGWTAGGAGSAINVTGGVFTMSGAGASYNLGHGAQASLNISGGTANLNRTLGMANNSSLNVSGSGILNINEYISAGGNVNVSGGTVNFQRSGGSHFGLQTTSVMTLTSGQVNAVTEDLYLGLAGNGTINQSGGTLSTGTRLFSLASASGTAAYNQSGGTLETSVFSNGGGTASYTFSGGTLKATGALNLATGGITTSITGTATGGSTLDSNGNTVTVNAGQINLGSGGSLTKTGAGSLTINNDAGFSTGTWNVNGGSVDTVGYFNGANVNVAGGTLNINRAGGSHFGLGSTATVTLASGAINNTGDLYLGFATGGNGTLNQSGGTLSVSDDFFVGGLGGAGTWNITGGTQSITAVLSVESGGVININSGGTLGKAPTIQSGGVVNVNGGGALTTPTDVTINAGGLLKLGGGSILINSGTGYIANSGTYDVNGQTVAAGSYEASYFAAANAKLMNSSATAATIVGTGNKNTVWFPSSGAVIETVGDLTIGSIVTDGGTGNGFTKAGAGRLVLTNDSNSYAGATTISAGTLQVGDGGTSGVLGAGAVTNNASLVFNRSNAISVANAISGTGALTKLGAGTLTLTGSNTYGGSTTISAGTLEVGNGGTTGSLGAGAVINDGALVFNRSNTVSLANVISGTGTLTKQGAGALTLSGANTYTGATNVSAGQLFLLGNTAANATGNLSVAAAAWLGGSGAIGGATSVSGLHSPGNADAEPGLQTFTNGLSYAAGSTFVWELVENTADAVSRGSFFDAVNLTTAGALAIDSGATLSLVFNSAFGSQVDWSNAFWGSDQQWTIFDNSAQNTWDGTLFGTVLVGNDKDGDSLASARPNASFSITNSGGDLILNYVAVPEPGALALAGIGVVAAAWALRRRL